MPTFKTSHVVNHAPRQMFDLVADVEAYPQFVPLCQALRIRRRFDETGGAETVVCEMEVGYKAIRERFTSRVKLDRAANSDRCRLCRRALQPSGKHMALYRGRGRQVPGRILHRL